MIGSVRIGAIAIRHICRFNYFVLPESSGNADLLQSSRAEHDSER
jgi:hypothetical protein